MELQLFNSLENKITKTDLRLGQTINVYLCGPTVHDHIHVGNLRSVIIFDVLHRLLLNLNIKVNYIQNITDIDDKIIAKAKKEKKTEKEISQHYTKAYFDNLIRYGIIFPTYSPRVTNYIPQIKDFVASLLEKKVAYKKNGEIFFRFGENKDYGKLSGQNLEKLKSVREINKSSKINNKDFILWKKTNEGIIWDSPWGRGRPGWHTECVVFVQEFFEGQKIDIHGGGNDLLFPHHENERIQYLANNNEELSKIWLHVAHLNWGKEKMSKSLGNVIFAKHFYQKYDANVLRYFILNSNYSQIINFSDELIQQSVNYISKIKKLFKKLNFYLYTEKMKVEKRETKKNREMVDILLNNLNTVKILFFFEKIITFLNRSIDARSKDKDFYEAVSDFYFILDILGFKFKLLSYDLVTKLLIREWQKLRQKNKYIKADEIRRELQKKGIL